MRPLLYGFLIALKEGGLGVGSWGGERERQKDLMKGYEEPAPIYIHYQRFGFSQSLTEEAPVSLSHSSPSTPPHCSFIPPSLWLLSLDPQESPHQQVFSVKQASREGETDRGAKLGPCMRWGLVLGAPPAGVTLRPRCTRCLITSLLIYHVWTYSCSSGLDSKQIAGGL